MITFVITIIVGIVSYTFGILVGLKISNFFINVHNEPQEKENTLEKNNNNVLQIEYSIDPNTSSVTSEDIFIPDETNKALKNQYIQKIQALVLSQQLMLTKSPITIFSTEMKFKSYVNNPYVTIKQLEYLLMLLNQEEIFEWSKIVLDKIKQIQNE